MRPELLERMQVWVSDAEAALAADDLESQTELSPAGRSLRSMSWIVEGSARMSQVVLWEDGQSEIELAKVGAGDVYSEHRLIGNETELVDLLQSIKSYLLRSGDG